MNLYDMTVSFESGKQRRQPAQQTSSTQASFRLDTFGPTAEGLVDKVLPQVNRNGYGYPVHPP